jgi:phage/plasmid-associated DNA primase
LRTGLSGKRQEKLFMANGVGRNGKGVLNELMMACCGNYGHKMNISVLVDKIKDGPNTSVNNLNMKRFVVTNEPNDNENILAGNIKRITGDMVIPARGLYSSSEDTTLNLSLVLELNKMINIKGRIDHAMISRLVSIRFENIFTSDPEILKNNPNAYPENPKLKDPDFQNKFRHAMFKYLLDSPDDLYICQACKQETMEYFKNQNEMYNWFIENYRKTDAEHSYISMKDIYNHWKDSDLYINMTKNEKRANTMKKFKQTQILENNEMRPYYIEKTNKKINGKMEYISNCLFGWELIPPECMVDMEDE